MKRIFFFILLVYSFLSISCQNLIPNPDFEIHNRKFSFRTLGSLSNWESSGFGGADFYEGRFKKYDEYSGKYMVGFMVDLDNLGKYHYEYITVKLDSTLKKNAIYCLKLYLIRNDFFDYAFEKMDFTFTPRKIIHFIKSDVIKVNRYYHLTNRDTLYDTEIWTELYTYYKASGGEKYLTLGWFNNPVNFIPAFCKMSQRHSTYTCAYYFVDNLSLIQINDTNDCVCKKVYYDISKIQNNELYDSTNNTLYKKRFVLNTITFSTNSYILNQESKDKLNYLFDILKRNEYLKVKINGFTDNKGNNDNNKELSYKRAESVGNYLINKGISKNRISCYGYGKDRPIESNNTSEGRSANRRVEVEFLRE